MTTSTRWRWMLAVAAATLGAASLSATPKPGDPAPAFTAQTIDGKKVSLADYRGKSAVLLNFYANF